MSIIIPANSAVGGGFDVDNSLRLNSASSDYLSRSSTAGNKKTWTFSFWLKRSKLDVLQFIAFSDVANYFRMRITSGNVFEIFDSNGNTTWNWYPLLRDTAAWYHLVLRADSTDGTNGNRLRLYINGTLALANTVGSISQNYDFSFNQGGTFQIAKGNSTDYLDGYLAETILIDGQALAPTDFGEFDEDSGIWKPIDVSGLTFGTNGFYLDFEDSSALGNDAAGSNNFTVNNLTAIDQSTDTCTNNFATMNPLDNYWQGSAFSEGSLTVTTTNASQSYNTSSIMVSSGKWYVECKPVSGGSEPEIGIFSKLTGANAGNNSQLSYNANGYAYRASDPGSVWYNGSAVSTSFSQYANGDIVGIALDLDNNKLYFSKNGTFGNSGNPTSGSTGTGAISIVAPTSTTLGAYGFAANESFNDQNKVFSWNFGSPPYAISSGNTDGNGYGNFEYAVPSGYLSLCTANLSEVDS